MMPVTVSVYAALLHKGLMHVQIQKIILPSLHISLDDHWS